MTGISPKDAIKQKKVPLLENYPPEDTLPEDGCIGTCCNPEKNMTTSIREQRIGYGEEDLQIKRGS